MKGSVVLAAGSAALASAVATPANGEVKANVARAATLPTVTVKGNGRSRRSHINRTIADDS